jgi:hypothetical protein
MPVLLVVATLAAPLCPLGAQVPLMPPAPPAAPSAAAPPPPATPVIAPPPDRIQVQELASVNPNETGLIDDEQGSLGSGMWGGSTLGLIARALPMLPNQPGWRSLRSLELRLLESPASLPIGKQDGEPVLALRAGKLAAMGAPDDAQQLLSHMPSPKLSPAMRRQMIDAALLSGDTAGACAEEPALRAAFPGDTYSQQIQVFCQFLAGKGNEAGLGVDLLRDQKLRDPAFFAAADSLAGLPAGKTDWVGQATPVSVAMAILAKLPLPDSAIPGAPPFLLPALVRAPTLSPDAHLAAAERAVALGILPADRLRQLYEGVTATSDAAAGVNEAGRTPKSRALLYKAAEQQPVPTDRAALIQRALAADPAIAPLVYAPMLAGLQASPDLVGFAPWAVRSLLAAGRYEAAKPWLGMLRTEDLVGVGGTGVAALRPITRLAGLGDPLTSADLAAWRQTRNEAPAEATKRTLLLCLTTALGDPAPEEDWLTLLDGPAIITGKVSRSALSVGLLQAAAAQRRGETALYVLLSLGESRDVEPAEFARLVWSLNNAGLQADARALAVEIALAFGI